MDVHGLKCDTPGCGYIDMTIPRKDYEKWIGKPCPVCGGQLLTQEDYDAVVLLESYEKTPIAKIEAALGFRTKVNLNGTGLAGASMEVTRENLNG